MDTARTFNGWNGLAGLTETVEKALTLTPLPARLFLAALFIWSGYGKITGWEQTAGYMAAYGMPLVPFFLLMAMLFEIGGGLSVLLGFKARLGAMALVVFLVPTTLIFHRFWTYPEAEQFIQMIMLMKNTAIIGGLLMVVRFGAGELSIDHFLNKKE